MSARGTARSATSPAAAWRPVDADEPRRVAEAVRELALRFAVVTSVNRDDLPDGGAAHFAATIRQIRAPESRLRRRGADPRLPGRPAGARDGARRAARGPQPQPRDRAAPLPGAAPAGRLPRARCRCCAARASGPTVPGAAVRVKTGIMVGVGETRDEVLDADARRRRARRADPDHRPVPAADRAAPSGHALGHTATSSTARRGRPRAGHRLGRGRARWCARATTRASRPGWTSVHPAPRAPPAPAPDDRRPPLAPWAALAYAAILPGCLPRPAPPATTVPARSSMKRWGSACWVSPAASPRSCDGEQVFLATVADRAARPISRTWLRSAADIQQARVAWPRSR